MNNRVDVLMPTLGMKGDTTIKSLAAHFRGFDFNVYHSAVYGWSNAINTLINKYHEADRDVMIIDDDVTILPDTFRDFHDYYDQADVFGFKLMYPDGRLQHGGGFVTPNASAGHLTEGADEPSFVSYVTASLCYIKAEVIEQMRWLHKDGPFNVWPGVQWEDVAFCMDAWAVGFKVAYLPNEAIHEETGTKRFEDDLNHKLTINAIEFRRAYQSMCTRMSLAMGINRRLPLGHFDV